MAALAAADRAKIARGLMRYWSDQRRTIGILKADLYNVSANTGAIRIPKVIIVDCKAI
jgi:hypothetical protein